MAYIIQKSPPFPSETSPVSPSSPMSFEATARCSMLLPASTRALNLHDRSGRKTEGKNIDQWNFMLEVGGWRLVGIEDR